MLIDCLPRPEPNTSPLSGPSSWSASRPSFASLPLPCVRCLLRDIPFVCLGLTPHSTVATRAVLRHIATLIQQANDPGAKEGRAEKEVYAYNILLGGYTMLTVCFSHLDFDPQRLRLCRPLRDLWIYRRGTCGANQGWISARPASPGMAQGRGGHQGQPWAEQCQEAGRVLAPWAADEQRGLGLPDG